MVVNITDGPIQIRYANDAFIVNNKSVQGSTYQAPISFKTAIGFNNLSSNYLNDSLTGYILDTVSDRISQLNVAGVDY